jgi:16S rRNA (guanine527-N7)-methyltransferase
LERILAESQRLGFLGPGPITTHIERALDLALALSSPPGTALDLGSGGGVPGLPLALLWERARWVLLDGSVTRAAFLERAADELAQSGRIKVLARRAEEAARGEMRGSFDLVTARSFAGPGATAECGSPFLKPGGVLLVAEPPGGEPSRWDRGGLDQLGMDLGDAASEPTAYQCLVQVRPCPDRYPRRVGIPAKRPLF